MTTYPVGRLGPLPVQTSLLDDGPVQVSPVAAVGQQRAAGPAVAAAPARQELSAGAWLQVQRRWVAGADTLFWHLLREVPWRAERRRMYGLDVEVPRLLAFYGAGQRWPHPVLSALAEQLSTRFADDPGGPFVTAGLCLYRDGNDSVAWHGDRHGRGAHQDTVVAIVSLGAPRTLLLRPRGGGGAVRVALGPGDLAVMGGSCQRTWEHCIPKSARPVGPRISVQFRQRGVR